jgi:hypothetical protein
MVRHAGWILFDEQAGPIHENKRILARRLNEVVNTGIPV